MAIGVSGFETLAKIARFYDAQTILNLQYCKSLYKFCKCLCVILLSRNLK